MKSARQATTVSSKQMTNYDVEMLTNVFGKVNKVLQDFSVTTATDEVKTVVCAVMELLAVLCLGFCIAFLDSVHSICPQIVETTVHTLSNVMAANTTGVIDNTLTSKLVNYYTHGIS